MEKKIKGLIICVVIVLIISVITSWGAKVAAASAPPPAPIKLIGIWWGPKPDESPAQGLWLLKKRLEKETQGRVRMDVVAAGILGKAAENYDLVVKGVADVVCFGAPYTPGRFPMTSVGDLPIWAPSIEIGAKAFNKLIKKGYFDQEYKDVMLIGIFSNQPYMFGWSKKPVTKLADFKGKKVRTPGGIYPKMLEALGASAVSLPVGELSPALEKGIIDGSMINDSMIQSLKFQEIIRYLTGPRCSFFMGGMAFNKRSYARLPKDVQAIIDNNREAMVDRAVEAQIEDAEEGHVIFDKSGGKTDILSAADVKKMKELYAPIFREWINNMEAKGLPGQKIIDDLYSIFGELGVKEPFIVPPK